MHLFADVGDTIFFLDLSSTLILRRDAGGSSSGCCSSTRRWLDDAAGFSVAGAIDGSIGTPGPADALNPWRDSGTGAATAGSTLIRLASAAKYLASQSARIASMIRALHNSE